MATTCRHCGATTDNDARVMCPSCGRRMRAATEPPAPAGPPPPAPPPPPSYVEGPPYATPPSPYAPSSPYAAPSPYAPTSSADLSLPPPVEVAFRRDAIGGTSRLTVAFRLLLAVPHLIALYAVSIAAELVAVVAWFAALFTARVPAGMYGFIGWAVAYGGRVLAYLGLLTDRWPTFTESPDDPVVVRLPGPDRLNRAAVFFRFILAIPAALLAGLLGVGATLAGIVLWLVVLVAGRVPQPVFDAVASVVRYQVRYYSYFGLLTARYPHAVFGDPDAATMPPAPDVAEAAPPVVTRGARRLLIAFVVLGVVGYGGFFALGAVNGVQQVKAQRAYDDVSSAYGSLHVTSDSTCTGTADELGCLRETARQNASTMRGFSESFGNVDFPTGRTIRGDVDDVRFATSVFIQDLDALSQAGSLGDYRRLLSDRDVQQAGRAFDQAVQQLEDDLQAYANGDSTP